MDDVRRVLVHDFTATIGYVPHLVGALMILLIGGCIAWLLGRVVTALLSRVGLDKLGHRRGLTEDLAIVGIAAPPSRLIGRLIFIIFLIAALNQAVDTLEFAPLSVALRDLLNFTPHLVLAAALVIVGVIVADMLARGAADAMSRAGVLYHGVACSLLRTIVIVLALLMALQQLTIDSGFLLYVLLMVLGGATLAFGIAGGWGARTLAENLVAGRYVEREFAIGDFVRVDGTAGKIERLSSTSVIVRTDDDRRVTVPNGLLTRMAVESKPGTPPAS
ncbi:MAG: mechanosensitive ion channel [Candidatus Eremiobacteraeota bacterium]|nr:mechanosensitive ion channel [Candidatus Eremiobacteraeota bacterium]MBC5803306.1 mechanosensitive ion channel [Candidatus Eremiobacteraeota bacterium]MBC5822915.1 mechanosensitive ion channel [Candidatus Eremiobacteraeota bacterium]